MSNTSENQTKLQVFLLKDAKNIFPKGKQLLGIDYGMKRIGLALSDTHGQFAEPFKIIYKLKELDDIIPAKNIEAIVIGLPLQTNGEEGDIAKQVHLFANRLVEKYNLPVFLHKYSNAFNAAIARIFIIASGMAPSSIPIPTSYEPSIYGDQS